MQPTINNKRIFSWKIWSADLLILLGLIIIGLTFGSPLYQEVKYQLNRVRKVEYRLLPENGTMSDSNTSLLTKEIVITPASREFGIFIPKIGANAQVFPNIDPFDEKVFLPVLRKGVAQAKGTKFPGQGGNIYLFAHSTDAFFNVGRYNAVFYLIGELGQGDEIDIYYQNRLYQYSVVEKKVVAPQAVEYLQPTQTEILTLQTCYPPGTTLKRLVVRATPNNSNPVE